MENKRRPWSLKEGLNSQADGGRAVAELIRDLQLTFSRLPRTPDSTVRKESWRQILGFLRVSEPRMIELWNPMVGTDCSWYSGKS